VLPHLWFRNTWSWGKQSLPTPRIEEGPRGKDSISLQAHGAAPLSNLLFPYDLGSYYLYGPSDGRALFTDNETNAERIWGPQGKNRSRYVKDGFHRHVVNKEKDAVNPAGVGTKACFHLANVMVPARAA